MSGVPSCATDAATTWPGLAGSAEPLLEPLPLGQIALRNTLWNGVQFVINLVAGLAASAVVARSLGPTGMGAYSYLIWMTSVLVVVGTLGLPEALLKYVSEFMGRGDRGLAAAIARRLLAVQFISAASVAVMGFALATAVLKTFDVRLIALSVALVLPQVMLRATNGVLAGLHRYDLIAFVTLWGAVAQLGSIVTAAWLRTGVSGMLVATLAAAAVALGVSLRAVRRGLPTEARAAGVAERRQAFRRVHIFSAMLGYILLLELVLWQRSEIFLLKRYLTLADIAFYSLAFAIAAKAGQVAATLMGALLPVFSASFGSHGVKQLGGFFHKALKYVQMVMIPLCVAGVLLMAPGVRWLYGEVYSPAVIVGQILLAAMAVTSLAGVGADIVYATDHAPFIAKWGTVLGIIKIGLLFALVPRLGLVGAALASGGTQAVTTLLVLRYAGALVAARFPWATTGRIYVSALAAAAPAICGSWLHARTLWITALLAAGLPIYLGLLIVMRELGRHERSHVAGLWASAKPFLLRFRRLRSAWYFLIELRKSLGDNASRSRAHCEREFQSQVDPLGFARECEQRRFRRALQMLDDVRGASSFRNALEVGCAEGMFTELLATRCDSLLAVDFSPTALRRASERCARELAVRLQELDVRRDPVEGKFDLIVLVGVLEYVHRPRDLSAIRDKLVKALRPGGYLLVGNTVRSPVVENSRWAGWLRRGTRLNAFVAQHPQVRVVESASEEFGLPFIHTLVRKV